MAFIEGWPHLRGGLYEGFHCMSKHFQWLITSTVYLLAGADVAGWFIAVTENGGGPVKIEPDDDVPIVHVPMVW